MLAGAQPWAGPLPKPLLRQAGGSELSGLAASKVVFVSAPAQAKEQLKPTTSGKKVWCLLVVIEASVTIIVVIDTVLPVGDFS